MLAPLRDYFCPKEPSSSPLLRTTKEQYFHRLSVGVDPGQPSFEEARWIMSEDVNVEHLLNVFTSIDTDSIDVWTVCSYFMEHIYWHKPRLVVLGLKIEGLPDDHPSKPECLFRLSWLFTSVGNNVKRKRVLVHALELWRERGVSSTLQKKPHHAQSIFWLNLAINSRSVIVTVSSAIYVAPRVRQRRLSITSRQPSGLRLPSIGTIISFGSITTWRSCFPTQEDLTTHTGVSNGLSHTRSITHTTWVLRAADIYERLGAARDLEDCRALLQEIEEGTRKTDTPGG